MKLIVLSCLVQLLPRSEAMPAQRTHAAALGSLDRLDQNLTAVDYGEAADGHAHADMGRDGHAGADVDAHADAVSAVFGDETDHSGLEDASLTRDSLQDVMRDMTLDKALGILSNHDAVPSELHRMVQLELGGAVKRTGERSDSRLRGVQGNPSNAAKAKDMLNAMALQSWNKLDVEKLRCFEYKNSQEMLVKQARGEMVALNALLPSARGRVLQANAVLSRTKKSLEQTSTNIDSLKQRCDSDTVSVQTQIQLARQDEENIDKIVAMSSCRDDEQRAALSLLVCRREGSASFLTFSHGPPRTALLELSTSHSRHAVQAGLREIYRQAQQTGNATNGTLPADLVGNMAPMMTPATDDVPKSKAQAKCQQRASPDCDMLRDKFSQIQLDLVDKIDHLKTRLVKIEHSCDTQRANMVSQMEAVQGELDSAQEELAAGTQQVSQTSGQSRIKQEQVNQLTKEAVSMKKRCDVNIDKFKGEICGFQKIRNELNMLANVTERCTDCEVSAWQPNMCSASCSTGTQVLHRNVMAQPSECGVKCPPLQMLRKCNQQPCPTDCRTSDWASWSSCSAECGGGVMVRTRDVLVEPQHSGVPCGPTSQSVPCNVASCDTACVLQDWTAWSGCSQMCDGGLRSRTRDIKTPASHGGTCWGKRDEMRLQYQPCNEQECHRELGDFVRHQRSDCGGTEFDEFKDGFQGLVGECLEKCRSLEGCTGFVRVNNANGTVIGKCFFKREKLKELTEYKADDRDCYERMRAPVVCASKVDIILVLDGSGSIRRSGWNATKQAAKRLIRAFESLTSDVQVGTILFSGPNGASEKRICTGRSLAGSVNMSETCKIRRVTELTKDLDAAERDITALRWPRGGTLTSAALMAAKQMLCGSRTDAQSVVMVLTDGRLSFKSMTKLAAKRVRQQARLLWVPVTPFAPLADIRSWASRPPRENVIRVEGFETLSKQRTTSTFIAKICPKVA